MCSCLDHKSRKLPTPSIGSLYNPSELVAAEFEAILVAPQFIVLRYGKSSSMPRFLKHWRIRIVTLSAMNPTWETLSAERLSEGLYHRQYHPLHILAALGFADY